MRLASILLLLVIAAPALAAGRDEPPPSAANLLRRHPGPWRLPASMQRSAMRVDPETGETAELARNARAATTASLRQAAAATIRTRADGSRHAVLGAAFRSWTVVRTGEDGKLVMDCVDDLELAQKRVEAGAEVPR